MHMKMIRFLCALAALWTSQYACAVGIANDGAYKVQTGERDPAPISDNIRIVPPPTGGNLQVSIRTDRARSCRKCGHRSR